jgi:hypothetical protein
MGKIYNIQLNSANATTVSTANSNLTYNIDWADLLPENKKFKVTFGYMGGLNFGNNSTFPSIKTNLLGNAYRPATNGYQNSYYLGHLRPILVMTPNTTPIITYVNYTASISDNPPIYLENRPRDNNLQVQISNGTGTTDFQETYLTPAGSGSLTQSGFLITVSTVTAGLITVGTVITPTSLPARTITAFVNGTGSGGTYLCNLSATISTSTIFTFPADTTQSYIAPYVMNLYFEEVNE